MQDFWLVTTEQPVVKAALCQNWDSNSYNTYAKRQRIVYDIVDVPA